MVNYYSTECNQSYDEDTKELTYSPVRDTTSVAQNIEWI
jgi:hypothetical protein